MMSFARHYKTGAPLPEALFSKLDAAKNFRSASGLLRQASAARAQAGTWGARRRTAGLELPTPPASQRPW